MRAFLRVASLLALVVPLVPACGASHACTLELDGFGLTMQRTFDVQAANADFAAIDVCAGTSCSRAGAKDATGAQTFGDAPMNGSGTLTTSAAPDGRLVVSAHIEVSEQTAPLTITITVHDRVGTAYEATATVTFHDTGAGCHSAPDTTTI